MAVIHFRTSYNLFHLEMCLQVVQEFSVGEDQSIKVVYAKSPRHLHLSLSAFVSF